jgi:tetratricopeptide (TPR) repeat protein
MKTQLITLLSAWLITATSAFGCLNGEYYELADGSVLYTDAEGFFVPNGHQFYDEEMDIAIKNLDSLWKQTKDVKYLSDYALILIIKKRYKEAEAIYLQIEKDFPGRYSTASNLGTLYELTGENEKALKWISRAVEIDPHSHFNSEWIHVNILKAKLQGEDAYNSDFLLGTNFGEYDLPSTSLNGVQLRDLQFALYYQLNERISFISPPDKIVGILLASLGDVLWLNGYQGYSPKVYTSALKYEGQNSLVKTRLKKSKEKRIALKIGQIPTKKQDYTWLVVGLLSLTGIATFAFIRQRYS